MCIGAAWAYAINSIHNRKLKQVPYFIIMFYHGIGGILISTIYILIEGAIKGTFRTYTGMQYLLLICASFTDMIAVNGMTISY